MTASSGTAELRELILPVNANHHGTLFAGQGLQMLAKAAFLAARSLAQRECVMAGVSAVDFMAPVPIGHQLTLQAWVSRVGRSSMTVCVNGLADLPGIPPEAVMKAVFEMVAVDGQGKPAPIDRNYLDNENPA